MGNALIGYATGLVFGGIVNLGIYVSIKSDLNVEKNLYKKMTKDLDDLVERIQKEHKEKNND